MPESHITCCWSDDGAEKRRHSEQMRITIADLVSNTCFPVLAAEELGFYKAEGLDAHVELVFGPPFSLLAALGLN